MEIGIDRFLFAGRHAPDGHGSNPVPDLLEEIQQADKAGIHVFGIGEHHTSEFADSSPAVLLSAAAARTSAIRLSSAITILSLADPVRLLEDFATLDLVSNGRAEIIAGRGAYAEAFSLFGADMSRYDDLYSEKLDLLLKLRTGDPVHWTGKFRPRLTGQTSYPRPVQDVLPVWVGATGSPVSFARAGTLGLPLALGVIGGEFARLRHLVDLYRQAGERAGHSRDRLKVAVHAIGYVGDSADAARSDLFPSYRAIFGPIWEKAGAPPMTRTLFDEMTMSGQALIVGDEGEVVEKLLHVDRVLGGVSRICLQMTVGPLQRERRLGTIARLGNVSTAMKRRAGEGRFPNFITSPEEAA